MALGPYSVTKQPFLLRFWWVQDQLPGGHPTREGTDDLRADVGPVAARACPVSLRNRALWRVTGTAGQLRLSEAVPRRCFLWRSSVREPTKAK